MYKPLNIKGHFKRLKAGKPFPHILIKNAITGSQAVSLRQAVEEEPKKKWNSDLYQFWQTDDLKKSQLPAIQEFVLWFTSLDMKEAVKDITGISVLGPVDVSGFLYEDTDHLLPHDDRMPGRKVAYILYLTSSKKGDGGTLDLFETTSSGKPTVIKKSVLPCAGNLVLFPVTKRSFHQVAEVVSQKPRITIGGWFNG